MRIAICGGTGFIGQALTERWLGEGHEVFIVTRTVPTSRDLGRRQTEGRLSYLTWDDLKQRPDQLEHLDAIVNLAGASLSQRWTARAKARIMDSREQTVAAVAELMERLVHKPPVVVQASAMGIYGTSETGTFDEECPAVVQDFPSRVVELWEAAADRIPARRLVKLRISVVLGNEGGAFPKMLLPYKLGVGGKIGSGRQWFSWIHIDDMVELIDYCIRQEEISGPVNAASPHAVTNDQFGRTVAAVYRRPHWFPLPAFLLKLVLGEMSIILLEGQHIVPAKAVKHGFRFRYPRLEAALAQLKERDGFQPDTL